MTMKEFEGLRDKLRRDPVLFAEAVLGFIVFPYQAELLRSQSKRIVACWARQTGKTTAIAIKVIHFAFTNAETTTLIVSRGLRQSMIMFGVIENLVTTHPVLRRSVVRSTRTMIQFSNGSRIVALPCGPDGASLRGYTADLVVCVPGYVRVTLDDGTEVPISEVKLGQIVLSYNQAKGTVEPKKVLRVRRNRLDDRSLVRVFHDYGFLDCTSDHRIFIVGKGFVHAERLSGLDKMLYLLDINKCAVYPNDTIQQALIQIKGQSSSRTVYLRESSGRFRYTKNEEKPKKRLLVSESLVKASGIRSIQTLDLKEFRQNSAPKGCKQGVGKRICSACWKKGDLQPWVCKETLLRIQKSLQKKANKTFEDRKMRCLWPSFQAEEALSKNLQPGVQQETSCNGSAEKDTVVYNLEVEGNHNYFANRILVSNCDEAAFMPEDVIASVIFPMLATTNGSAIMLSTPWGRDHIFYRSFKNPNYWSQHVRAEECPRISREFLEEQRRDIGELRYKMEYEAEFVEEENSFFSQDLIRECVEDYDPIDEGQLRSEGKIPGDYYLGADFGKKVDYSVVSLLKEEENQRLRLVFLKQSALGTPYTDVVAFIQRLDQKFDVMKGYVDQSAVGESLVEEIKEFAPQIGGLAFTAKVKQDLMILLQTRMEQKRIILPLDRTLLSQINEQQYRFGRAKPTEKPEEKGLMTFYHPPGTHDDQLWALALAVYAAKEKEPEPRLYAVR